MRRRVSPPLRARWQFRHCLLITSLMLVLSVFGATTHDLTTSELAGSSSSSRSADADAVSNETVWVPEFEVPGRFPPPDAHEHPPQAILVSLKRVDTAATATDGDGRSASSTTPTDLLSLPGLGALLAGSANSVSLLTLLCVMRN